MAAGAWLSRCLSRGCTGAGLALQLMRTWTRPGQDAWSEPQLEHIPSSRRTPAGLCALTPCDTGQGQTVKMRSTHSDGMSVNPTESWDKKDLRNLTPSFPVKISPA